ncbi:hypothetical protein BVG19_g2554 [[Candida] boidinii]|nr:hypothetical protein BVG19_g2554 [[Candida] boidinii]OWB49178.1 hypothetical protein B5S27_g718 [[Candida] boidinii]
MFGSKPPGGNFSFGSGSGTTGGAASALNKSSSFSFSSPANTAASSAPTSLGFGSASNTASNTGGFGSSSTSNAATGTNNASSGLAGGFSLNNSSATAKPASGFAFGGSSTTNSGTTAKPASGFAFGASSTGTAATSGLGGSTAGSLFGNKPSLGGISGNTGGSLFGGQQQQQQQQQQQTQQSISTAPVSNQQTSSQPSFAWSSNQNSNSNSSTANNKLNTSANNQYNTLFGYGNNNNNNNTTSNNLLMGNNNNNNNANNNTYVPTINDQLMKVKNSWDPNSPQCATKTYFYNKIASNEMISNYQRPDDQLPEEWEKAMANRPKNYNSIPVKAKGFEDLLKRSNLQIEHIKQSRLILNQINENLTKLSEKHDLDTVSRLLACKVKHKNLSKRLLKIAIILSVLKSKGYPLTNDEELLSQEFDKLLKSVDDPIGLARSNELWARLSNLKERSKNLSQQLKRLEALDKNSTEFNSLLGNSSASNLNSSINTDDSSAITIAKITDVLSKQQQGIQFLYEILEKDKETVSKLSKKYSNE